MVCVGFHLWSKVVSGGSPWAFGPGETEAEAMLMLTLTLGKTEQSVDC